MKLSYSLFSTVVIWCCFFLDAFLLTCIVPFMSISLKDNGSTLLEVALLFASKSVVQILISPFIGYWSIDLSVMSLTWLLIIGTMITIGSCVTFIMFDTFASFITARAIQGITSSIYATAGMSYLASTYTTDELRGKYMSWAISGTGLAVFVGPPAGGFLYQLGGRRLLFFVGAGFAGFILLLQLFVFITYRQNIRDSYIKLEASDEKSFLQRFVMSLTPLKDPLILVVCGAELMGNACVAMVEPLLPVYLEKKFHWNFTELGFVFISSTSAYFLCTVLLGYFSRKVGRIRCMIFGLIILGATLAGLTYPFNYASQVASITGIGLSLSLIDTAAGPLISAVIDKRHSKDGGYGQAFSGIDMAFSLSYAIGPLIGNAVNYSFGFQWTTYAFAIAAVLYIPTFLSFRGFYDRSSEMREVNK